MRLDRRHLRCAATLVLVLVSPLPVQAEGPADFKGAAVGSIAGTITETESGTVLANSTMQFGLYDAGGNLLGSPMVTTDETGGYQLDGIPQGDLYLTARIWATAFHRTQLYSHIDCPAHICPPVASGERLTIASGGLTDGVDFAFDPAAVVRGTVTESATGQPLGNVQISACFEGTFGPWCSFATQSSEVDGSYHLLVDARSDYVIVARATEAYADQMYPNIPCSKRCGDDLGNGIIVNEGDRISGIDFVLHPSSRLAGIVRDAMTGDPLPNAFVAAFDENYQQIWTDYADPTGMYVGRKMQGGTYYVSAAVWMNGCSFYMDRPCPADDSIPISSVLPTPITITDGEDRDDIDIRIVRSAIFRDGFDAAVSPL